MNTRVWCPHRPLVVLVAGMAAMAVLFSGCGKPPPSAPPAPPRAAAPPAPLSPPPPPPAIALAELSPVTLDPGGRAKVELKVERGGNAGPIQVQLADVPEGISVSPITIPDGAATGQLELSAGEKAGEKGGTGDLKATLRVTAKLGEMTAERPLPLVVNKPKLPKFLPVADVVVQPGKTVYVDLALERNGYPGSLPLRVEGLPAKITGAALDLAAWQNATKLQIAAAADAPDGKHTFRVVTTAGGRTVEAPVTLQIDRFPYRVRSFMVVTLKPGETKSVQIPVERASYKGPVRVSPADLPEGVTASGVEVPPDQGVVKLDVAAAKEARERVRSVKVRSTGGNYSGEEPLVIRISRGESGFLPREVTANPEMVHLLRRGGFGGRLTAESKKALLEAYGGTAESEAAVLRGLAWLAAHQQSDGRWSLKNYFKDVPDCDCHGKPEAEAVDSDAAGTAFGLLPFLGAGVTHDRAPEQPPELARYRGNVKRAIAFLLKSQVSSKDPLQDGRLDGNMYAHALGTMALCEAYGLTGEQRTLKAAAQRAIKYIVEAQDPAGGGWRYGPRQPGDMSVVGWVFLAIRSGKLAGLGLKPGPLNKAQGFVDTCAAGPKEAKLSRYGYQAKSGATPALSAAGLLTRQYLGWTKDTRELEAGCRYLMENLPPESGDQLGAIYYYYYATQVLHHMEGSAFDLWNHRMREHLIRTQGKKGHAEGSWSPEGADWGKQGGRLYTTSLALMTLEVYYRHLPLYRMIVLGSADR